MSKSTTIYDINKYSLLLLQKRVSSIEFCISPGTKTAQNQGKSVESEWKSNRGKYVSRKDAMLRRGAQLYYNRNRENERHRINCREKKIEREQRSVAQQRRRRHGIPLSSGLIRTKRVLPGPRCRWPQRRRKAAARALGGRGVHTAWSLRRVTG